MSDLYEALSMNNRLSMTSPLLPGSLLSTLCCELGCCERGPGVPPDPGDRTSSLPGPGYDSDEEGGLCNKKTNTVNLRKHQLEQSGMKLGMYRNI